MGWAYQDSASTTDYSTDTTITGVVTVAIGDLIVVGASSGDDAITITAVADSGGVNVYALRDLMYDPATAKCHRMAYCLSSQSSGDLTVTVTYDAGNQLRQIVIGVFRPDSGDTVTLSDSATKAGTFEISPWETGSFDVEEADSVAIALFHGNTTETFSNHEIPSGSAATVLASDTTTTTGFYKIFSGTTSGIIAEVDVSAQANYTAEVLLFKSTAPVGGSKVPLMMADYRRLRA